MLSPYIFLVRCGQNFEGFRFSESLKFFYHSSSNSKFPGFSTSSLTKIANDLLNKRYAYDCNGTTQPSLHPGHFVSERSLTFMKSCWIKFKCQRKVFSNCRWVWRGCWKFPPWPWNLIFSPTRLVDQAGSQNWSLPSEGSGLGEGSLGWNGAKGPFICWSYWAPCPWESSGFTSGVHSWTWTISPMKQASSTSSFLHTHCSLLGFGSIAPCNLVLKSLWHMKKNLFLKSPLEHLNCHFKTLKYGVFIQKYLLITHQS